ncbi:MAG: divergent polysaccharide deacetylase family protein [Pseudomonadota bacterium]
MRTIIWLQGIALAFAVQFTAVPVLLADEAQLTNVSARLTDSRATVSIIIDDVGHNRRYGEQIARLPVPLTLSILPHTPFDQHFANLGRTLGKEVMLHMPMQAIGNRSPSQHQLEVDMSKLAFMAKLRDNLNAFDGYTGINNHQGSRLMGNATRLDWMMAEIADRNVFFVDSRTIGRSPATQIASRYGIVTSDRDIFLDHEVSEHAISRAFDQLVNRALRDGYAVAIGHPHPATIAVLKRKLPTLARRGIAVVPVSTTIAMQSGATLYADGRSSADFIPSATVATTQSVDPLLREISDTELYTATR